MSERDASTAIDASEARQGPGPRYLLVTSRGALRAQPLPEAPEVTIGRGEECDVVLDHAKVSRRHLLLRLGDTPSITDLGSRNGTTYQGKTLAPNREQPLGPGESFAIGPFVLMVLPPAAGAPVTPTPGAALRVEDPAPARPPALLTAIARSPINVLIRGETGAGKEVLAATLHRLSGRGGPYVGVNCAALAPSLLESELFGYERGAFTGALANKAGLLEAAAGGTVLLDEIGDMPAELQAKLLRAIEAREVLRVGGVRPQPIDVRFMAATHADLLDDEGFRRDLYYRLAGVTLEIPPLRERRDQVTSIALELVAAAAARTGTPPAGIAAPALDKLRQHDWPGNVRELRNVVERALLLAGGGEVQAAHILFDRATGAAAAAAPPAAPSSSAKDAERARIIAALADNAGNQTRAARQLGISRATLLHRIEVLDIPRPRGKS